MNRSILNGLVLHERTNERTNETNELMNEWMNKTNEQTDADIYKYCVVDMSQRTNKLTADYSYLKHISNKSMFVERPLPELQVFYIRTKICYNDMVRYRVNLLYSSKASYMFLWFVFQRKDLRSLSIYFVQKHQQPESFGACVCRLVGLTRWPFVCLSVTLSTWFPIRSSVCPSFHFPNRLDPPKTYWLVSLFCYFIT